MKKTILMIAVMLSAVLSVPVFAEQVPTLTPCTTDADCSAELETCNYYGEPYNANLCGFDEVFICVDNGACGNNNCNVIDFFGTDTGFDPFGQFGGFDCDTFGNGGQEVDCEVRFPQLPKENCFIADECCLPLIDEDGGADLCDVNGEGSFGEAFTSSINCIQGELRLLCEGDDYNDDFDCIRAKSPWIKMGFLEQQSEGFQQTGAVSPNNKTSYAACLQHNSST